MIDMKNDRTAFEDFFGALKDKAAGTKNAASAKAGEMTRQSEAFRNVLDTVRTVNLESKSFETKALGKKLPGSERDLSRTNENVDKAVRNLERQSEKTVKRAEKPARPERAASAKNTRETANVDEEETDEEEADVVEDIVSDAAPEEKTADSGKTNEKKSKQKLLSMNVTDGLKITSEMVAAAAVPEKMSVIEPKNKILEKAIEIAGTEEVSPTDVEEGTAVQSAALSNIRENAKETDGEKMTQSVRHKSRKENINADLNLLSGSDLEGLDEFLSGLEGDGLDLSKIKTPKENFHAVLTGVSEEMPEEFKDALASLDISSVKAKPSKANADMHASANKAADVSKLPSEMQKYIDEIKTLLKEGEKITVKRDETPASAVRMTSASVSVPLSMMEGENQKTLSPSAMKGSASPAASVAAETVTDRPVDLSQGASSHNQNDFSMNSGAGFKGAEGTDAGSSLKSGEGFKDALKEVGGLAKADPAAGKSVPVFGTMTEARAEEMTKTAAKQADVKMADAPEIKDQIKVDLKKAVNEGLDKINITLKPKELGTIQVKLEMSEKGVKATFTASRPETLEMLQKDAASLEKALQDAGLKADLSSLNFDFKGGHSFAGSQQDASDARFARDMNYRERPAAETEAQNLTDLTESIIATSHSNSRYAVNIRV